MPLEDSTVTAAALPALLGVAAHCLSADWTGSFGTSTAASARTAERAAAAVGHSRAEACDRARAMATGRAVGPKFNAAPTMPDPRAKYFSGTISELSDQ